MGSLRALTKPGLAPEFRRWSQLYQALRGCLPQKWDRLRSRRSVPAMKMGLAPIRRIGACPIFMIQRATPQHDQRSHFHDSGCRLRREKRSRFCWGLLEERAICRAPLVAIRPRSRSSMEPDLQYIRRRLKLRSRNSVRQIGSISGRTGMSCEADCQPFISHRSRVRR
jgi:hypothetical protein